MIATLLLALGAVPSASTAPFVLVAQEAADEEIWQVDQLRLPPDTPASKIKALGPDHTMDAVIARLRKMGIHFSRLKTGIRAEMLPPAMRDQLMKLPKGEPFVLPGSDFITINVIIGRNLPADMVRFVPRTGSPALSKA